MPKILVCQHVAYEILGTLDPLLRGHGFRIRYVNFGRHPDAQPSLDGYQGLVILGGPMNVDQTDRHPHLTTEMQLVDEALARDIPILGVCLGAQLLARALGAEVRRSPEKEIGWYDIAPTEEAASDPLLGHIAGPEKVFQWHGDMFDIPRDAVHLATSADCPNQAFRYGVKAYGFQFHLEVDQPMIDRWLHEPHMRHELEPVGGAARAETIRRETGEHIERLHHLSDRTFGELVRLLGARQKPRILPSR